MICILGLGLTSGSMMCDLRAYNVECLGWNRSSTTIEETTKEEFDASINLQATLERAEASRVLIVIGAPIVAVDTTLDTISEHAPGCGTTGVVSVKATVAAEVSARGMEERFVGAHPMVGSAQTGWSVTLEGLFDGVPWVITYDLAVTADAAGKSVPERWIEVSLQVANLEVALGSQLVPALSDHYDISVARISHMPRLAAYAIAAAGEASGPLAISLAAGSFRDCTRVAAAAPDIVVSWCENNTEPVLAALDDVVERLTAAHTQLAVEGTAMDLTRTDQIAHVRYEAHPAHRLISRLRVGEGDWINQLKLAESVGGQVDMF